MVYRSNWTQVITDLDHLHYSWANLNIYIFGFIIFSIMKPCIAVIKISFSHINISHLQQLTLYCCFFEMANGILKSNNVSPQLLVTMDVLSGLQHPSPLWSGKILQQCMFGTVHCYNLSRRHTFPIIIFLIISWTDVYMYVYLIWHLCLCESTLLFNP